MLILWMWLQNQCLEIGLTCNLRNQNHIFNHNAYLQVIIVSGIKILSKYSPYSPEIKHFKINDDFDLYFGRFLRLPKYQVPIIFLTASYL